jgi:voltage-gated potassium channel Kch
MMLNSNSTQLNPLFVEVIGDIFAQERGFLVCHMIVSREIAFFALFGRFLQNPQTVPRVFALSLTGIFRISVCETIEERQVFGIFFCFAICLSKPV